MFLSTLHQFDKATLVYNNLLRLQPNNGRLYLMRGSLYEHIRDTISAQKDFQTSLKIYNSILDTMSSKNRDYSAVLFDKALLLIMLDQQEQGNRLLKRLCNEEKNKTMKEVICSYVNKTKKELLTFEPPDHSVDSASVTIEKD